MSTSLEQALNNTAVSTSVDDSLPPEIQMASTEEISNRTKLLENDIKIMKSDQLRITHEQVFSFLSIFDMVGWCGLLERQRNPCPGTNLIT
jgi:hypothetical protein